MMPTKIPGRTPGVKKFKNSIYLPEKENHMVNELYAKRLLANKKTDKSSLICEAIHLLYAAESKDSSDIYLKKGSV